MKKIFTYLIMSCVLTACSKTNEEAEKAKITPATGGNPVSCDTVNMKYATNVQPIIKANCYSCHGNGQTQGGINLDTYTQVKQHANSGLLIGVITHASGYSLMPLGQPRLSDCDINKIKDWIARGTLNN